MVKALNSYKHHCNGDGTSARNKNLALADDTVLHINGTTFSPRDRESVTPDTDNVNESTNSFHPAEQMKVGRTYDYDSLVAQLWANNFNMKQNVSSDAQDANSKTHYEKRVGRDSVSSCESSDADHDNFKLAHCRLIYNDVKTKRRTRPKSAALLEKSSKSLDSSGGVLVDSMGHVYGRSKPRPWSALPCKFSAFMKTATVGPGEVRDNQSFSSDDNLGKLSFQSGQVKIVTLQPPQQAMAQPITRSVAFNRRNRTTFSWSDTPGMSQSLPNASFLHKQYTCSQPRMINTPQSASPTGRAGKPSFAPQRPNSSYSYDGGFFLGAHSGQAEYFVIHPDWVSEALTIRKLNGNKSDEEKVKNYKSKPPQRRWSDNSRRCLSAPPPKFRNPITWNASNNTDAVDIPKVK